MAKLKEYISGQVYYTKNYKKTDFTNLGYHIRRRNDDKLTCPEKPQFEFEVEGGVEYAKTVTEMLKKYLFCFRASMCLSKTWWTCS